MANCDSDTSVWSMGDNTNSSSSGQDNRSRIQRSMSEIRLTFDQSTVSSADDNGFSSATETLSWGDNSSCYSTLTNGSTDSNISDAQKLRGDVIVFFLLIIFMIYVYLNRFT